MGCKSSKAKDAEDEIRSRILPNRADDRSASVETVTLCKRFAMCVLPQFRMFLHSSQCTTPPPCTPTSASPEKVNSTKFGAEMLGFANTVAEVLRQNYHTTPETAMSVVSRCLIEIGEENIARTVTPKIADQRQLRLLSAVIRHGGSTSNEKIACENVELILSELGIVPGAKELHACTFEQLLALISNWDDRPEIFHVFEKFAGPKSLMDANDLQRFLKEAQSSETTSFAYVDELINRKFGGSLTAKKFSEHFGHAERNSILNPSKVMCVSEDMTRPLTHYHLHSSVVTGYHELYAALRYGCRSFLVDIVESNTADAAHVKENGPQVRIELKPDEPPLYFAKFLHIVKERGFTMSSYPIALTFSVANVSVDVQTAMARLMEREFKSQLVRGLMFDGGGVTDSRFTPAALQNKILICTQQRELKPFVGLYVSDMNRMGLGVKVTDVKEGTPAATAGVVQGSWLTHFNGKGITGKSDLKDRLKNLHTGDEFVLKSENIKEIRVHVGGVMNEQRDADDKLSLDLSRLAFFVYHTGVAPDETNGSPHPLWIADSADFCKGQNESLVAHRSEALMNHLGIAISVSESWQQCIADHCLAMKHGFQFMFARPAHPTRLARYSRWMMSRFAENARCGYVLKNRTPIPKRSQLVLTLLGPPQRLDCDRSSTSMSVSVLLAGSDTDYAQEQTAIVSYHRNGEHLDQSPRFSFDVPDMNSYTLCVSIEATFSYADSHSDSVLYESYLPCHLIREGYRSLPLTSIAFSTAETVLVSPLTQNPSLQIETDAPNTPPRPSSSVFCFVEKSTNVTPIKGQPK